MRRWLWALLLGLCLGMALPHHHPGHAEVIWGIVAPGPGLALEVLWPTEPGSVERGYCAEWTSIPTPTGPVMLVTGVRPVTNYNATPSSVMFSCRREEVMLHTHLPETCLGTSVCIPGGPEAFQCTPSPVDVRSLETSHEAFGIVQCGERHFVFYKPV
jgi:hypothetical protein